MSRAVFVMLLVACSQRETAPRPPVAVGSGWREDLALLASTIEAKHANAFFTVPATTWHHDVEALDHSLPGLDDEHALVAFARLVASIGDGHTMIAMYNTAGIYPLAFTWFDDGIYVTGATDATAVGSKLVGIGEHPLEQVLASLAPLIPHDNDAAVHDRMASVLVDRALLEGADLAAGGHAVYKLASADGGVRALELVPGHSYTPVAPPAKLPLHLQGPNANYWNKYVDDDRLIYFAYNACADDPHGKPFAAFAAGTLAFADTHPVDRFVIDLRRNDGGNSEILRPLLDGLAARPALAGRVFAIIGMHTFSSAMLDAMELSRRVHARLVGTATSGKPTSYGEIKTFVLSHSKLLVQYSTRLFQNPDFAGDSLQPDVPVTVTSADWFSGRDPALDAILATPVPAAAAHLAR